MIKRFYRAVLGHRYLILTLLASMAAYMGYKASHVAIESHAVDVFPADHPYVETYTQYADTFGGATTVLIAIEVREGTIFNRETLGKLHRISREVDELPGVNHYQVLSLAQRKVKVSEVNPQLGMHNAPLMWPDVPQTQSEIDELQRRVLESQYYGSLVSRDQKAALVLAGFFEDKLQPARVRDAIIEWAQRESDENTAVRAIGRPMLLGDIAARSPELGLIMLATVVGMLLVLLLHFRNTAGVVVPAAAASFAAVMGFGFLGVLNLNFDPLVLVIPFIITARALSHSVQFVSRFLEERAQAEDARQAAERTATALFKPGALAIATDMLGIALIYIAPIPLLQKLALMGAFWLLSIFFSGMLLTPILMSMSKATTARGRGQHAWLDVPLNGLGRFCTGRTRNTVFVAFAVLLAGSLFAARQLVVGDVYPGTPMLWPDSRYNQDTDAIAERFTNTEQLSVVVEGDEKYAIRSPEVLATMEGLQRHMELLPEVGASSSVVDLVPGVFSLFHGHDPKYELVPRRREQSGFFLEMIFHGSQPGDLARYITPNSQIANIMLFLRDHKGTTLRKIIAHAKDFIQTHPMPGAEFRLAGGYGGLLAAINEEVTALDAQITLAAFTTVFACCLLAYRSLLGALIFLLPLLISNTMTYALMGVLGIGLDVNALPVVALGVGLGVDYGLYVVERIQEAYRSGLEKQEAIRAGLRSAGRGVLITGLTMALGLAFWRWSFLRFQADMGILLLFWMSMSMLGALVLLPAIVSAFEPRFVFHDQDARHPVDEGGAPSLARSAG